MRWPSRTAGAVFEAASERNLRGAIGGIQALRSMPKTFSIAARAGLVRFTALIVEVTIGMPANIPTLSVEVRNLSVAFAPWLRKWTALARSIRCGKSRFHGCGGTYGHFVM